MSFLGQARRLAASRTHGQVCPDHWRDSSALGLCLFSSTGGARTHHQRLLPKTTLKVHILTAGADDGIRTDRRRHRRKRHQPAVDTMTRTPIGDPRFFARCGPHSLATVAETACGAAPSIGLQLTGVAPLQTARPDEVSFLDNRRYASALEATSAGAVIVHPDMLPRVPGRDGADRHHGALCRMGAGRCAVPPGTAGVPGRASVSDRRRGG